MPFGWGAAIGAGVSAIGSIASGVIGSQAADKAAKEQAQSQAAALALQQSQFNQTAQQAAPYQAYGTNALQNLQQLLGIGQGGQGPIAANPILKMLGLGPSGASGQIDPSTFEGSPGYTYAKQQGLDAISNKNTLGPGGGNALLALQRAGTGLADQNWGNYLSETSGAWQQLLQNIGGGVSTGMNATSLMSGRGTDFANAAGGNLANIGNANAQGTMNSASAIGGGITGGIQNASSFLTNPTVMRTLSDYFNSGSNPNSPANVSAYNDAASGVNIFQQGNPFASQ